MTRRTETLEVALDAALLDEARRLGVDLSAAAEIGLRDALRHARVQRDLADLAQPSNDLS
ncbi:type II toxin-antitoxin system CcdA family antitoxin (plasmid) [Salipiger sp. H15]|uniref:Type II toxin-antitoxin system CcdA family antitoxin n=1 Tax=Alloyangia sp. H15 TaxID=3029062 RepID=A0AAU8ASN0_9RHOB